MVHLPNEPTAYFKLALIELSRRISVRPLKMSFVKLITTTEFQNHAWSTAHFPELVLNNFVARLGHSVGRMF